MVQVAVITFSSDPNVTEAKLEIHRESRGRRELWVARPMRADSLPFPSHAILQQSEIPLCFLAPKAEGDPKEFGDSRGLEKAVVNLLQLVEADSGSLVLIETEWFANLSIESLCRELSQRVVPIKDKWAQLSDRLLENEDAIFDVDMHAQVVSEVLSSFERNDDDTVQVPRKLAVNAELPRGVAARTGIILNNRAWVMLAGNPSDREFVPMYLEWSPNDETFSELIFVPDLGWTPRADTDDIGQRVRSTRAPSGSRIIFTQSDSDPVGSVQVEPELLLRPYYESALE